MHFLPGLTCWLVQPSIDARLDVVEGTVPYSICFSVCYNTICACAEFVQSEDLYADVRDALKTLNKMDFDKLIASVRIYITRFFYARKLFYSLHQKKRE